jgi:hypothetical protein
VKVAGRKKAPFPKLSAEDAHTALRWLHVTGAVTAKQIVAALREREDLVEEIRRRLEELTRLQGIGGDRARFLTSSAALRRPSRRRHRKASTEAVAAWRAQGRYLAAVRRLSKAHRRKVKRIREAKGVGAAIAAAKKIANR